MPLPIDQLVALVWSEEYQEWVPPSLLHENADSVTEDNVLLKRIEEDASR